MLGDDEGRGGQVDDLMPGRLRIARLGSGRERRLAAVASLGEMVDDRIDAILGDLLARMAAMTRLSATTSLGRRFGLWPGSVWWVGRGGDRGVSGVVTQALFELGDGGLERSDPVSESLALGTVR
jgi:hypothetical protein